MDITKFQKQMQQASVKRTDTRLPNFYNQINWNKVSKNFPTAQMDMRDAIQIIAQIHNKPQVVDLYDTFSASLDSHGETSIYDTAIVKMWCELNAVYEISNTLSISDDAEKYSLLLGIKKQFDPSEATDNMLFPIIKTDNNMYFYTSSFKKAKNSDIKSLVNYCSKNTYFAYDELSYNIILANFQKNLPILVDAILENRDSIESIMSTNDVCKVSLDLVDSDVVVNTVVYMYTLGKIVSCDIYLDGELCARFLDDIDGYNSHTVETLYDLQSSGHWTISNMAVEVDNEYQEYNISEIEGVQ